MLMQCYACPKAPINNRQLIRTYACVDVCRCSCRHAYRPIRMHQITYTRLTRVRTNVSTGLPTYDRTRNLDNMTAYSYTMRVPTLDNPNITRYRYSSCRHNSLFFAHPLVSLYIFCRHTIDICHWYNLTMKSVHLGLLGVDLNLNAFVVWHVWHSIGWK